MRDVWAVKPGSKVDISTLDPADTRALKGGHREADAALNADRAALIEWQTRLWAESKRSLLLIVQGTDASGKDGTIAHVFSGVNPQGTRVTAFKVPTAEELAHDFLWRVHRAAPRAGEIGIFNRSQYEDVLVARVRKLVPNMYGSSATTTSMPSSRCSAKAARRSSSAACSSPRTSSAGGFEERLKDPQKRWKFQRGDLEDRALWNQYQTAYSEAIERTSTKAAPWYVIPADLKWYRNWAVSRLLIETLKRDGSEIPRSDRPRRADDNLIRCS